MSKREIDSRGEKAMGVFLDTYFYPKATAKRAFAYYERIYAKELQKKGIDVLLDKDKKIDEKAQLYYINQPVDSFAFEIDYYDEKNEMVVDGWFIENNETDEYLLMWIPKARTNHINRLVAEDFICVNADLLQKKRIQAYVEQLGLTKKVLKEKANMMRNENIERMDISDMCHIVYSIKGFSERPINLVVEKTVIDDLSDRIFEIKKDELKILR